MKTETILAGLESLSLKDRIELAAKLLAALVVVAYVIGLLITNIHIRGFGVSYLSFLQIQYVMAGLLWLFLALGAACLIVVVQSVFSQMYREKWKSLDSKVEKAGLMFVSLWGIATPILAWAFCAVWFLSDRTMEFESRQFLFFFSVIALNAVVAWAAVRGFKDIILMLWLTPKSLLSEFRGSGAAEASGEDKNLIEENKPSFAGAVFALFVVIFLLTVCLSLYAWYAYPYLSPSFGGGKSQRVLMLMKEDIRDTATALGFEFLPESRNIGQQEIIFETSDFYLLLPPKNREDVAAIRVNKDMVEAIAYVSDQSK